MKVKKISFLILLLIILSSCAKNSVAQKKNDIEVASTQTQLNEGVVETPRDLIQKSTDLNSMQKEKLLVIEEKNRNEYTRITSEIEKTKINLVQTILKPKMNQKEFRALKKKLLKLDKQRVNNGLESVANARDVIAPMEKAQREQFDNLLFHRMINGM